MAAQWQWVVLAEKLLLVSLGLFNVDSVWLHVTDWGSTSR